MAFAVRINGEEVKTFDKQVTGVRVRTSSGEASAVGISNAGAVEILVDTVDVHDPTRLDVVEANQQKARREFWDEHEGESTGPVADRPAPELNAKQDLSDPEAELQYPETPEQPEDTPGVAGIPPQGTNESYTLNTGETSI